MQEVRRKHQKEGLPSLARNRTTSAMFALTHEHPQPKAECQFGASIPPGKVICTTVFCEYLFGHCLEHLRAYPGMTPASKVPSKKRTAHAWARVCTNAVPREQMPNPSVVAGRNHPGPMTLQQIVAGISKMMYEM